MVRSVLSKSVEGLEYPLPLIARDSRAIVRHPDGHVSITRFATHVDRGAAREALAVLKQVHEHALHVRRVNAHVQRL